jgi:hypothetical protein
MSILKSFNLKKENRETKLDDFNFLFKKKKPNPRSTKRRQDTIIISKTSISIRPEVAENYHINAKCYAALILDEKKVGLVVRDREDDQLYAVQGGKNKHSLYIHVPKASQEFIVNFQGEYEVGETKVVEGKYLILDLIKIKEND